MWVYDKETGMDIYKPSRYLKEELPTWNEIYDDFYSHWLDDSSLYNIHGKNPYWKVLNRDFIIATMCNQFNKMLHEDGFMEKISENVHLRNIDDQELEIENLRFQLQSKDDNVIDWTEEPIIYSFAEDVDKVLTNENPRFNPTSFGDHYKMILLAVIKEENDMHKINSYTLDTIFTERIIMFLLNPIISYFEGESVGWKDKDGNFLPSNKIRLCRNSGYDPAL